MDKKFRPWQVSLFFHLSFAGLVLILMKIPLPQETYEVSIEMALPSELQNLDEIKEQPKVILKSINQAPTKALPRREVFGASRDSYKEESKDAIDFKLGNTIAKDVDDLKLKDSDASSLPTPTEEYLVSEMPVVISEVRPTYPQEAKSKGLEGAVALDVLIDNLGNVRLVKVIEGDKVFQAGAIEAMKRFKFKPAKVDGSPVAVRIRYTLNFKLEF